MANDYSTFDVCVVGSGISGSAIAAYLGKNGVRVAIVEQNWGEPDEIIGELLQPGGVLKLREMGFQDAFKGFDAQPINGYAMFLDQDFIQISYPVEKGGVANGYGFRYGRFVQKLRSYLDNEPTIEKFDGKVTRILEDEGAKIKGVEFQSNHLRETQQILAHLTIICQGTSSRLRVGFSNATVKVKGHMLGLILEDCDAPFANYGHVIIAKPAPVLVYPVTHDKLRVLIDFPKDFSIARGEELESHLIRHICPQLPAQIQNSFIKAVRKGDFKFKPTTLLTAKPVLKQNAVLLGDSLNQRHPTTGGGMTVALTDVQALGSELIKIKDFEDGAAIRSAIKTFYKARYKENATINILAYALYSVFRHPLLQKACFSYLKKGGKFAAEPMSILSGISRNRLLLLRHFFLVAFHGISNTLKPIPTPGRLAQSYSILSDAIKIITPLIIDEFALVQFNGKNGRRMTVKPK